LETLSGKAGPFRLLLMASAAAFAGAMVLYSGVWMFTIRRGFCGTPAAFGRVVCKKGREPPPKSGPVMRYSLQGLAGDLRFFLPLDGTR